MVTLIAYYRVSTKKQGQSGLGLDGQRAAVQAFAQRHDAKIIATYTEVESGKRSDRPELKRAIAHAKRSKARLAVAKLDRLSRNVAFLSTLMDSGVDFVACDNEHANRLTVHILAAVAEAEAHAISERTKAALAAAKRRGVKLGSSRPGHWRGLEHRRQFGLKAATKASLQVRQEAARDYYTDLIPTMKDLRRAGQSLRAIAAQLNEMGHTTRGKLPWNPMQVRNVLLRFA